MCITNRRPIPFRLALSATLAVVWAMTPPVMGCGPDEPATDAEAAQAVGQLLEAGKDGPAENAQGAVERQRKLQIAQQIAQQAKQMEQFFQPALRAELEIVKKTCGSLPAEARKQIAASGLDAVRKTAVVFAARQINGEANRKQFDARELIQAAVMAALRPHASAQEMAAYEAEGHQRLKRRARAARFLIVAKLDQQLDLTAGQRQAIEAALEEKWEAAWVQELQDNGAMIINNYRPAPDFAAACIEPHLDANQLREWKKWSKQAGWRDMGGHFGPSNDGHTPQPDPWWEK